MTRLVRWSRRPGVVSALLLLLALAVLLLNHASDLGLARAPLPAVLRGHLQAEAPASSGLAQVLPAGELMAVGGRLRLGGRDLGECPSLVGVVEQADRVLAVCSNRLWLLTPDGRVMAEADRQQGVPEGLSAVGRGAGQVLLRAGPEQLAVDLQDLSLKPAAPAPGVSWGASGRVPADDVAGGERLLSEGRFSARVGRLLLDALALLCGALGLGLLFLSRRPRED